MKTELTHAQLIGIAQKLLELWRGAGCPDLTMPHLVATRADDGREVFCFMDTDICLQVVAYESEADRLGIAIYFCGMNASGLFANLRDGSQQPGVCTHILCPPNLSVEESAVGVVGLMAGVLIAAAKWCGDVRALDGLDCDLARRVKAELEEKEIATSIAKGLPARQRLGAARL
jgi:hypothetical protein